MSKQTEQPSPSETIRAALLERTRPTGTHSLRMVSNETGIAYQTIHSFARGGRSSTKEAGRLLGGRINSATLDRLIDYFGYRLVKRRKPKKPPTPSQPSAS